MGIVDTYNNLISQVITSLKTSSLTTAYLADAATQPVGPRVVEYKDNIGWRMVDNDYFAIVSAGPMTVIGGYTTRATYNEFTIGVSLMYFSTDYVAGFPAAMTVAEKIYDLFHLTNINNLCRVAYVSIYPDPIVDASGNLYTIVIHCTIKCETYIVQP